MNFHVVTMFPDTIRAYVDASILGRAQKGKHITISYHNPLDYAEPSKNGVLPRRIDDKPYGGGPGMVMRPEPVLAAIAAAVGRKRNYRIVHFAPRAEKFTTQIAAQIAQQSLGKTKAIRDIIFVCGRYEGIDSRVNKIYPGSTYSVGDYVLTGGELPAMIMIDSISRQLPKVLGDSDSREETRIAAGKYYTRPEALTYKGTKYSVPKVLVEGDHKKIDQWRAENG